MNIGDTVMVLYNTGRYEGEIGTVVGLVGGDIEVILAGRTRPTLFFPSDLALV